MISGSSPRPHTGQACGDRRLQAAARQQLGIGKDFARRAIGHQGPVSQHESARAQRQHHVEIVAGEDAGVAEPGQQVDQPSARLRVQATGGFVHHQQVGRHGQDTGNRDTLLLAARQPVRRPGAHGPHAHALERFLHAGSTSASPQALIARTEGDVVKTEAMKSWSSGSWNTRPTVRRTATTLDFVTGISQMRTSPRVGWRVAIEVQQQRGLAGAVGADDGDRLAVRDAKRHVPQRHRAVVIDMAQAARFDRVVAHGCRFT